MKAQQKCIITRYISFEFELILARFYCNYYKLIKVLFPEKILLLNLCFGE